MTIRPFPRLAPGKPVSRAFTLMELIAVMTIISVLALSATPMLASLAATREAVAAGEVQRDVAFARQRAVARGLRTWVDFNVAADTWAILEDDPAKPGLAGAVAVEWLSGQGGAYVRRLGEGEFAGVGLVSVSLGGGDAVGFDWIGRPVDATGAALAAQGSIELSGGSRVTVEARTGHVARSGP